MDDKRQADGGYPIPYRWRPALLAALVIVAIVAAVLLWSKMGAGGMVAVTVTAGILWKIIWHVPPGS
jgi:hypothetical protein